MRISTKGRGIIKAQQGTVARPNPKENKDNPDRVNVQQQGFRGANVFTLYVGINSTALTRLSIIKATTSKWTASTLSTT